MREISQKQLKVIIPSEGKCALNDAFFLRRRLFRVFLLPPPPFCKTKRPHSECAALIVLCQQCKALLGRKPRAGARQSSENAPLRWLPRILIRQRARSLCWSMMEVLFCSAVCVSVSPRASPLVELISIPRGKKTRSPLSPACPRRPTWSSVSADDFADDRRTNLFACALMRSICVLKGWLCFGLWTNNRTPSVPLWMAISARRQIKLAAAPSSTILPGEKWLCPGNMAF